ncbi:phage protein [Clostridium tetani]|uniref:hypothetical protein n=1 Tax=Clostridium tetani TaxID=1513 RepID=UPI000D21869B|nr:hypothetical protein [Clostridium tetani]AVP54503.1 hypothetical protein C3B72_04935 [Clostridium tetani]RXI75230.1 hypothetical protein DP128_11770 [Clostridium tetani]WFN62898.1 hypothetical protein PAA20_05475 [Clostridium tetani]SUY55105.1 phage protein [Clostridium tetani]BDR83502.1 hypothetical protein K254310026_09130 [Clostridium tetani]
MDKWTYELNENSDIWRGEVFNSKEEVIKKASSEAVKYGLNTFKIGIIEEAPNCGIDVDDILERANEIMYDEVGEVAEDYLCYVEEEHKRELEEELNKIFYAWQRKYNYEPDFYKIVHEEVIEL